MGNCVIITKQKNIITTKIQKTSGTANIVTAPIEELQENKFIDFPEWEGKF
jgi:hypothetical protein